MSGVQTLVVKSHQEASIVDVKNALMRELRGVEGLTVMPEESLVGASAASTMRALVAYAEWVHGTVFEQFSGQVVSKCFGWEDSV